ncbi:carbohydrate ABC transporter permease [Bifidobacterium biavatii]|uniref:ABC transporter, permease protein, probably Saturated and unsaturated oligogalacturonide transporter n=1 Tax=Bifidobacterium biavatii DSM 23969 TaxID=1437608 RepID=A0A087A155_9BIFI|nr:carbohydrate ABC transporter permease [Bifidobacterium biavatii]KFI52505.1 ABC transporter, permease protein, probably Saturated and unsaturated oligogalacturonide transporter [Bifidobacterium biavatii DSM 23969]
MSAAITSVSGSGPSAVSANRANHANRTRIKPGRIVYHVLVFAFALVMLYPIAWMVFSSFKPTNTVFSTAGQLIPTEWTLDNYVNGFKGFEESIPFYRYIGNSLFIAVTATIGTVFSSAIVAYALSRLHFKGRKVLFTAMMISMMLPAQVLMVPQYLWYQKLGWTDSYLPLIVPYCFAIQGFFIYLMMNFIEGIPRSLDEAAQIDGCSYYGIFARVIFPLLTPALVTGCIFSFMWRWDDFLGALLYVSDSAKLPVALALKMFADPSSSSDYGAMFAMASVSILPSVLIFLFFQKYLVEGVSTSGLKG